MRPGFASLLYGPGDMLQGVPGIPHRKYRREQRRTRGRPLKLEMRAELNGGATRGRTVIRIDRAPSVIDIVRDPFGFTFPREDAL